MVTLLHEMCMAHQAQNITQENITPH